MSAPVSGCYAYEPEHLQGTGETLRSVSDYKGDDLIDKVLELVDEHKPLHLSIVGGEPLVRFRECSILLPQLSEKRNCRAVCYKCGARNSERLEQD